VIAQAVGIPEFSFFLSDLEFSHGRSLYHPKTPFFWGIAGQQYPSRIC